ncbi:Methyltransferase type 11 [Thermodesulfobium narugense DSM 14796]|uniref:Methyltransferase type 11 n=1 Tax=Thermodesulfobium narugense DSM 14796 TaxID=747365 RepID=M1E648_9BACT|nr:class I SAM-dependent methyltransferase [Thermodesulfobium narugense]AEE14636.1 Methyltransferase type 11 [Thermodesulfobium narugense DSM 14796]
MIDISSYNAVVELSIKWKAYDISHEDRYFISKLNLWRDIFPKDFYDKLVNSDVGSVVEKEYLKGEYIEKYDSKNTFYINCSQFNKKFIKDRIIEPKFGRFYPKGIIEGISNIFKDNFEPFRVIGIERDKILVDFNHPFSNYNFIVSAKIINLRPKNPEIGGSCFDWIDKVAFEAGMKARWNNMPTDFFSGDSFKRDDESEDSLFYSFPRFVNHIDATAMEHISSIYSVLLKPDTDILDFMCSWNSHLPGKIKFKRVSGLGLNEQELSKNKVLDDWIVQDLNSNSTLPYDDNSFDSIICTVSIEYLVNPFEIFSEILRILKPGGIFIVTISNRWFPPKAIKIWQDLLEFERVGMVLEYFIQSGFRNINTLSIRGYPRPEGDKYFFKENFSDPIHAIWGFKKN